MENRDSNVMSAIASLLRILSKLSSAKKSENYIDRLLLGRISLAEIVPYPKRVLKICFYTHEKLKCHPKKGKLTMHSVMSFGAAHSQNGAIPHRLQSRLES